MKHLGTQTLETERLILRKFKQEDVPYAYQNWTSDPKVTPFLTWPVHANIQVTEKVIREYWMEHYAEANFYQWAIELKSLHEPIGTISVVHIDEPTHSVEIGYCIGSQFWHQGYVTEAFKAVIAYLFEQVQVKRICAKHDTLNPNSGRVMLKCGLTYEGTLRQAALNNRGIVDVACYSILAEEYEKQSV